MAILESRLQTGLAWAKESYALFKQAPSKWMLLALAYVGFFMILPSIPGMQFVSILIWPIFIAIAIRLFRSVDQKTNETISRVFLLVQPKLVTLMLLGVVCLVYCVLVNFILLSDIKVLTKLSQAGESLTPAQVEAAMPNLMPFVMKLLLLLTPMLMATWFSPMLIVFNQYPLVKAIKSSIAGSIQHMIAMSVAWLVITLAIVCLMLVAAVLAAILSAMMPTMVQVLMTLVLFGCMLFASALMLAFQYISYRDIFRAAPGT